MPSYLLNFIRLPPVGSANDNASIVTEPPSIASILTRFYSITSRRGSANGKGADVSSVYDHPQILAPLTVGAQPTVGNRLPSTICQLVVSIDDRYALGAFLTKPFINTAMLHTLANLELRL
jgi:hypothetical protein